MDEETSKYIHVYGDYFITMDDRQYSLFKDTGRMIVNKKTSLEEKVYQNLDHHANTMASIVKKIARLELLKETPQNIYELAKFYDEITQNIQAYIKKLFKED